MGEIDPGSGSKSAPRPRRTRRMSFGLRVRDRVRRATDRILGADVGWSLAFVLVSLVLLGSQSCGGELDALRPGEIAARDILAPEEIHVVDRELTEERRAEARAGVPEVYIHDTTRGPALAADLSALFEMGRRAAQEARANDPALEQRIPSRARKVLWDRRFEEGLERELTDSLSRAMAGPVVGNRALLEREERIVLVQLPGRGESTIDDYSGIADLAGAKRELRSEVTSRLRLSAAEEETLAEFVSSFLDANLYVDTEAARERREAAAEAVPPVLVRLSRGHVLIRKGERITSETLERLEAARGATSVVLGFRELTGLFFVVSMLAFFLYRYSLYHQRHFKKLAHLHALLVLMLLSMMLLTRALLWLAGNVVDTLGAPFSNLGAYPYLVPLGAGSILVALLANGRIATVYSAFAALLFGALNGWDFGFAAWAMLVQLSGVYTISAYRERAALLRGGLVVGGAGMVAALALASLEGGLEPLGSSLYSAGLAFVGGGGRRGTPGLVQPASSGGAFPGTHRHPPARALQREQPAALAAGRERAGFVQPQPRRGYAGRGGGPGGRRQLVVLPRGRDVPRHRQDQPRGVLCRKPAGHQSARSADTLDVGADHHLAREGWDQDGPRGGVARADHRHDPATPRHQADDLLL